MPIMNGFDEAKELTELIDKGVYRKVPIIAVTSYTDELTKKKCIECGISRLLSKPLMIEELKSVLIGCNIVIK